MVVPVIIICGTAMRIDSDLIFYGAVMKLFADVDEGLLRFGSVRMHLQ